jgi:peptidyl-prolyl cis-trans isomerase A (cyclophilin A)
MRRLATVLALAFSIPAAAAEAPAKGEASPKKAVRWSERAAAGEELFATFKTSAGDIEVRLFAKEAPKTVENFVALASGEKEWTDPNTGSKTSRPLYDGTEFHRVMPGFMIQGGDPLGTGTGGPGYRFEDEFQSGRKFDKPCTLAMANAGPNTNGSQFFITEVPTPWLNGKHTIFGEGIKGCELVARIAKSREGGGTLPPRVKIEKIVLSTRP